MAREAYQAMQKELADLHQELLSLRQPMVTTPAVATHEPSLVGGGGAAAALPSPLAAMRPELVLLGDLSSPLSADLEATRWSTGFKMPNVKAYEGNTNPTEFLRVYETADPPNILTGRWSSPDGGRRQ